MILQRPLAALAVALVTPLVAVLPSSPAHAVGDLYTPPATITGEPGTILRSTAGVYAFDTFAMSRADATVTKVQYVSTAASGGRTPVTGTVIVPKAPWRKAGERPIVAVSPGTQGLSDRCAPSRLLETARLADGAWIRKLYDAGYAVAVTDYEGLGTPGTHPYGHHVALGHNALDIVRAAQNLGYSRTAPVFLQGFSEGGGATAGALELAPTYAPELRLAGAHATAPAVDLAAIAASTESGTDQTVLLLAFTMLDATYPELGVRDLMSARGQELLDTADTAYGCFPQGLPDGWLDTRTLTKDGGTIASMLTRPDIAARLNELRLGKRPIAVPFAVTSAWSDAVVPNASVKQAAMDWCARGSTVSFTTLWSPTHLASGYEGSAQAVALFDGIVAGRPFASSCGWLF